MVTKICYGANSFNTYQKTVIAFVTLKQNTILFVNRFVHRLLFFNVYIKPHNEFYSVVWCNASNNNIDKINELQRRACKLIPAQEYDEHENSFKRFHMFLSFDQSVFTSFTKDHTKLDLLQTLALVLLLNFLNY